MISQQDLHTFLRTRRSIRRFGPDSVPRSVVERILATAITAPSAHNRQPWRFAVVQNESTKSALANAMAARFEADLRADGLPADTVASRVERSRSRLSSAPVVIILCMDPIEMDRYPDAARSESERLMAVQSTANAGVLLLLALHAEGLGGVWSCAPLFAGELVRRTLQLPPGWEPQALFMAGHPAETPQMPARKRVDEIAIFI